MAESSYALKRAGRHEPGEVVTKLRRRCDSCKQALAGRKGHGFPMPNGRGIECGGCARVG